MTLAPEIKRLNGELSHVMWRDADPYGGEVPLRLHEYGTDSGHGLGGPPFHPKFESYLRNAGACFCEPREIAGAMTLRHTCDRRFREERFGGAPARMHASKRQLHPFRLKRALRQLQNLVPYDQYHIVYLLIARRRPWTEALAQVNGNRERRGEPPYTTLEFQTMMIAGVDLLLTAW